MAHEDSVGRPVPTIEAVQADVGFANQFRIELIKLILALAPGLLAFTVAFRPRLKDPAYIELMWIGWVALGLATLGGMVNMFGWERFYISYRDHKNDLTKGDEARKKITFWRRAAAIFQFCGFGLGVMAIALFAIVNLDKAAAGGP